MNEKWLRKAIAEGFMGLITLRLEGAPAADAVTKTVDIWLIALTKGRTWDEEQDMFRIKSTFETLFATCERWPSPAQFLRDMPLPMSQPGLPAPALTDEQRKTGNVVLDEIISTLGGRARAQRTTALQTNKQFEVSRQKAQRSVNELQQKASQVQQTERYP